MNQRNTASNNQKTQKKVHFIDTLERRRKAFGSSFLLSFYYLEGKEFGSLGANLFFWPMWDGGYFLPLLTRKRRLQAWRSFGTFLGGDGVRSTARDQLSRRESWGMGATEESAQTPAMCILSPPTGESSGHQSYTVDAMHKHFHPSSRTSSRHWTPHHQPRALLQ
ncbi:hypothetical protein FOYG_12095 [Fusarium oxysporum NRRL 32931]|uniref:Uncharacterized protein n=1 Tax=Fusarium oxysporum NRRL 32931 TaxID=660029 RepID=W9HV31_FUSOX|nr:hypothetical protein FOYG_12095 [Fusarium oxysporum NRRL 32931]